MFRKAQYDSKTPAALTVWQDGQGHIDRNSAARTLNVVDNDTYDRFLRDEILTDVGTQYNLRQDSYSRAIGGNSSGGICSFNAGLVSPRDVQPGAVADRKLYQYSMASGGGRRRERTIWRMSTGAGPCHLSFGTGTHNGAQGIAERPLELTWLWRDYDAGKTEQTFVMEESEKGKPMFRVKIIGRE